MPLRLLRPLIRFRQTPQLSQSLSGRAFAKKLPPPKAYKPTPKPPEPPSASPAPKSKPATSVSTPSPSLNEIFRSSLRSILRFLSHFVRVAAFLWVIQEYVLDVKFCSGASMFPLIYHSGDAILISKLNRRGKNVRVGDVVEAKHPMIPGMLTAKRVTGMPGDFVVIEKDALEEPDQEDGVTREGMIQVPEGHCWLVGDNLPFSRDSRTYGPLPLALIKGKVIAKIWPLKKMQLIENGLKHPQDITDPRPLRFK